MTLTINASSPLIKNNTIHAGSTSSGTAHGIYALQSVATIDSNTIYGGAGSLSYGVKVGGGATSPIISNNTIDGGAGTTNGYCVYILSESPSINGNIFVFATSNSNGWGIYESGSDANPLSVSDNIFNFTPISGSLYFDNGNTLVVPTGCVNDFSLSVSLKNVSGSLSSWGNTHQ